MRDAGQLARDMRAAAAPRPGGRRRRRHSDPCPARIAASGASRYATSAPRLAHCSARRRARGAALLAWMPCTQAVRRASACRPWRRTRSKTNIRGRAGEAPEASADLGAEHRLQFVRVVFQARNDLAAIAPRRSPTRRVRLGQHHVRTRFGQMQRRRQVRRSRRRLTRTSACASACKGRTWAAAGRRSPPIDWRGASIGGRGDGPDHLRLVRTRVAVAVRQRAGKAEAVAGLQVEALAIDP